MEIEQFLLDRLAGTEERVRQLVMSPEARAIFAMFVENQRAIIEFHKKWPVMLERRPGMEITRADPEKYLIAMTQEIAFLTQEEYIKRFGKEPPTAPMLRKMAWSYRHHPDWKKEWTYAGP